MRLALGIAACSALLATVPAVAQDPSTLPAAPSSAAPAPVRRGANSFLEGQAREAIRKQGFENVSGLVNDSSGVWRGTATKGQHTFNISVDYKGQVDAQ
jgi:putative membrane protein